MRHAEAAYIGADGQLAADERLVPLTSNGREQARIQGLTLKDVHFDRVICSSLPRTQETAAIIVSGRHAPPLIEVMPPLEEIRIGHRHTPVEDLSSWIAHVANPWADARDEEARFLGGERFRDFEARVVPAFQSIVDATNWSSLLVVAHGAVNRVLLNHMMRLPWQGTVCIEQDPACINIIDVDHKDGLVTRYLVRGLNITAYNLTKAGIDLTDMERAAQRIAQQVANQSQ